MSDEKLIGYCLKCKEKREIQNPQAEWASNGSPATRGTCPVCGTTIYKRGHTAAHDTLPKPEITARPKKAKRSKTSKRASGKKGKKSSVSKNQVRRAGRLVVVESPAKAKTIGRYLGRGYVVKSSVGHVRDLLKSRLSVDVENNFEPEYRVPNDKRQVVKDLKEAAAKAKEIYLATDPDREGEAIAWHVLESAEMDPARTKRVVFHEITKPAIEAAFATPRDIDMDRVDAQQARRILDRLVGYKLSPLLWRKVRGRLSAGRVQSVAVRQVVEREREIEAFVSEEYWTLAAELSQQAGNGVERPSFTAKFHKFKGEDPVLQSQADVQPHLDALEKAIWTVGDVRLGKRTRRPAAPFTTSTMQQEASRRLNFGASKTMRVAQSLYEGVDIGEEGSTGLITYMRTDSVTVSKEAQAEARDFIIEEWGADSVPDSPPIYKTRAKAAQEAHEAVRPTSVRRTPKKMKQFLKRDEYRLYRLVWERFVASQMASAIYDTVSTDIWAGDGQVAVEQRPYLFRATGSTLRFAGFLALYEETKSEDATDENGDSTVPSDLTSGELLDLLKLLPEQHFTQPPPRYTEATLVKALEEHGIGRPSTYAAILSTIQQRGYVERHEKRLAPTETGLVVNDLLVKHFPQILSVNFTARLEDELDEIAEGKPWVPVLAEFYKDFSGNLEKADEAIPKIDLREEPEEVGRECPLCGSPLLYRQGRYGRFIGCSNFPTCRHTEQILEKIGVACPNDGGDLVVKRTRRGRVFYGCANYPDCDWTSWKKPIAQPCQKCGGLLVEINKTTAECTKCGERQHVEQKEAVSN
ncbi:MAG: type I DNA topoisomerase [Ardenticatenaceae bacterium]|nr:type I DNA topoisomerase [Anaerolineales bacterium]MCB8922554.1 type I DNA topoisomerase [Ardenticatenaceae bacterium]